MNARNVMVALAAAMLATTVAPMATAHDDPLNCNTADRTEDETFSIPGSAVPDSNLPAGDTEKWVTPFTLSAARTVTFDPTGDARLRIYEYASQASACVPVPVLLLDSENGAAESDTLLPGTYVMLIDNHESTTSIDYSVDFA